MPKNYLLISFLLFPQIAHAGAWLEQEGGGQIISGYSSMNSGAGFDESGNKQRSEGFAKQEYSLYGSYGLLENLTIGAAGAYSAVTSNNPIDQQDGEFSISSVSLFARRYLEKNDDYVISVEPALFLPKDTKSQLNPEGNNLIPELKIAYGQNFNIMGFNSFLDSGLAYRVRGSGLNDMAKIDLSLGSYLMDDLLLMNQVFYDQSLGSINNDPGNYDLVKYQVSAAYLLQERTWAQFAVFKNIDGKNTADGIGFVSSVWYKF